MTTVLSVLHGNTFGGPHNRNARVAPYLRAHHGVRTIALVPDEPGQASKRLQEHGVEVVKIEIPRLRASYNLKYHVHFLAGFERVVRRIRGLIHTKNVDVVQINGLSNPHAAEAARRAKVPVVWQLLDTFTPMWFRRLMMPYVIRRAPVIMATGNAVGMAHPGCSKLAEERRILFYPPVDLKHFRPHQAARSEARRVLAVPNHAPVIGNVSNLNPQKGHRLFLRAAAQLKRDLPNARFVILGQSYPAHRKYEQSLYALAEELGLELGADLLITAPGADVAKLATAFDVFWMTSEPYSEGVPTVILEALALGLPVVSTNVGAIAEVIQQGETGFVVESQDAFEIARLTRRILKNRQLREQMGTNARTYAEQHVGLGKCARQHLLAYNRALSLF